MIRQPHTASELFAYLGTLSRQVLAAPRQGHAGFENALQLICAAMGFHMAVLYKVTNQIDDELILEVLATEGERDERSDLRPGSKLALRLSAPRPEFINEVMAHQTQGISGINVAGWGCDLVGAIPMPADFGHGYLLAGDYFGAEAAVPEHEIHAFEIMCSLLGSVQMRLQFEHLAFHDGLTGLLNSRAIRQEMEAAFQRQRRQNNGNGAIVLADIDHFKQINDQYGHIQGDVVLQEVGRLIQACQRQHIDVAGRYGGEEFLLIYADSEPMQVTHIVDRLRELIAQHDFPRISSDGQPLPDESLHVTLSFGVARLGDLEAAQSREILAKADQALYQAKANGRNQVCFNEN